LVYLIVGLGNPGLKYEKTRHNAGFIIVEALAEKFGLKFKNESRFSGKVAQGIIYGKSVIMLEPLTYMNLSGQSVQQILSFYKIDLNNLIVITDDIALPFGQLRLRKSGSSGGHNGLASIEKSLGSSQYCRLKVGIGDRAHGTLEDHVLSRFTSDELSVLDNLKADCLEGISLWLTYGIDKAMNQVNKKRDPVVCEEK